MCSTATCRTRRSTARCAACCRCWQCNTTYRGPATPGTAAALAYGFAVPDENALLVKKLRGGIGALTSHLQEVFASNGGELRLRSKVDEILVADERVSRGPPRGRHDDHARRSSSPRIAPDLTVNDWSTAAAVPADIRERFSRVDHRGSYLQMHFALDGIPEFAAPYELLNDPDMQSNIGIFSTPEELQQQWEDCRRGIVPADPVDRAADPVGQRPRPGAARQARRVGVFAVVPDRGGRRRATAR